MDQQTQYILYVLNQLRPEMEKAIRLIESKNPQGMQLMHHLHSQNLFLLNSVPDDPHVLFTAATSNMYLGHNGQAIALLEKCLSKRPELREAWNNLGGCWRQEFYLDKAERCYEKTLDLIEEDPKSTDRDYGDTYSNIGSMWVNEGNPQKAEKFLAKAIEKDPNNAHACWNMGLAKLELKKYKEGFDLYDAGFFNGTRVIRQYGNAAYFRPGNDCGGKTIVVWGEQGLGDEILFAQYIPAFVERFKPQRLVFDCHPRLVTIWQRYFTERHGIPCYGTRKTTPDWLDKEPPLDFKIAIASLPQHVPTTSLPMALEEDYFLPEPNLVEEYRKLFTQLADGRTLVGFGWTGGYKKTRIDQRSIPLGLWRELFDIPGTVWVSFQYTDDAETQLNGFLNEYPAYADKIIHLPHIVKAFNYDDNLAALHAMDERIFINTTAVHACGASGLYAFTLTPTKHAWRYGVVGDDLMPFYTSVRQIHQGARNETMKSALRRVRNKLIGRMKRRGNA